MELTSIIVKPRLTEKTQNIKGFKNPKMSFVVHRKANKHQIAVAFKALFGISPKSINTINKKPSPARFMNKSRYNFKKAFKVAFVTVNTEDFENLQNRIMTEMEHQKEEEEKVKEKEAVVVEEEIKDGN